MHHLWWLTTAQYKKLFSEAEIWYTDNSAPGDFAYLGHGEAIRQQYIRLISDLLSANNYEKRHFNNIISPADIATMDERIMTVSDKVIGVRWLTSIHDTKDFYLAPTHEIPFMNMLRQYLDNNRRKLPLKVFDVNHAMRRPQDARFPWVLWPRETYIEANHVHPTFEEAQSHVAEAEEITRQVLADILGLPFIKVERPRMTNNPVSVSTTWFDVLTPLGRTLHAGMVYFQSKIFSEPFHVTTRNPLTGEEEPVHIVHFWFTDNLFLATIIQHIVANALLVPDAILPYHAALIHRDGDAAGNMTMDTIGAFLRQHNFKPKIFNALERKASNTTINKAIYQKINMQAPYVHIKGFANQNTLIVRFPPDLKDIEIPITRLIQAVQDQKFIRNEAIKVRAQAMVQERLIPCTSIAEVHEAVQGGYIAIVPLTYNQDTGANSLQNNPLLMLEDQLKAWEVLWYEAVAEPQTCIITGQRTNHIAYISRRI